MLLLFSEGSKLGEPIEGYTHERPESTATAALRAAGAVGMGLELRYVGVIYHSDESERRR